MGDRLNNCKHEAAHSVVRQILLGDLHETCMKRGNAYTSSADSTSFTDMSRGHLAKIVVIAQAGIVAEYELCDEVEVSKEWATADDVDLLKAIQIFAGFTEAEMSGFRQQARDMVAEHERAIRKVAKELNIKKKLSGSQVSKLMAQVAAREARKAA